MLLAAVLSVSFCFRLLLGLTEAANFPAATKAIAEWFPQSERSLAVGIFTMGPGLGAIIAPPLIAGIIMLWGWQAAFLIPGAFGFIWLILWKRWFHLPADHPGLPEDERQFILANTESVLVVSSDNPGNDERPWYWSLRYKEVWGPDAQPLRVGWSVLFLYLLVAFVSDAGAGLRPEGDCIVCLDPVSGS